MTYNHCHYVLGSSSQSVRFHLNLKITALTFASHLLSYDFLPCILMNGDISTSAARQSTREGERERSLTFNTPQLRARKDRE